ncbi:MAG: winged helix-turn-helix domain-containing protein [Candidatus Bathyarchaeota archaeon]
MNTKDDEVRRLVEEGLGSASRLRILYVLASNKAASQTKYGIERSTGLKPVDVRKHLKILVDTGWIKENRYNPPTYTLNLDNPKTGCLVDFFKKIGYM